MTHRNLVGHNVAILSAGRRVELLQAFRQELTKAVPSGKVYGLDRNPEMSSACMIADRFISCPPVNSDEYSQHLMTVCQAEGIGLVIPTIDPELLVLAREQQEFAKMGTHVVSCDLYFVEHCRDKRLSGTLFNSAGIRYPTIFSPTTVELPAFAKPISGSSSIGARVIRTSEAAGAAFAEPGTMIMEFVDRPFVEFTVDAFFNRHSRICSAVPRQRLETRAGEVSKSRTVRGKLAPALMERLSHWKGARGCVTVQLFYDESSDSILGLEINPRFGGGYPLSYSAGANYPGWLIREYFFDEEILPFNGWEAGLLMLRYDAKVLVRHGKAV